MNDTPRRASVTLEDLLRVKRAETPPAEFWAEFEQGMRTKQLAAIVEPRPWWAPLIRVSARMSRYQLPVGAAAILAITFVTLREYRVTEISPAYEPAVSIAASSSVDLSDLVPEVSADVIGAPISANVPMMVAETPILAPAAMNESSLQPAPAAEMIGSSSHLVPAAVELTPSARYIAENLAAARAGDPNLDRVLSGSLRTADLAVSQVEPLTQVNLPGESRRARLMGGTTWLASAGTNNDSALRTDDHASRRLTERRLSESEISRIDLGGSRLTVKF